MEPTKPKFRRICVFCGSKSGIKPVYSDAALELGKELVERKINLIYGGGSVGLMGLVSKTVHDGGCHVIGVIPKALMPSEISGQTVGELRVVADMHQRKAEMARHADAFIALPGGYGTLEELLEMTTWSQLGIHDKPVGLLNVEGYYNALLALFDKGVEEGFINPAARHIIVSAPSAREVIRKMETCTPKNGGYMAYIITSNQHERMKITRHEFEPVHDKVAPRQSWEMEKLGYCTGGKDVR